jgi:hypothetical protein
VLVPTDDAANGSFDAMRDFNPADMTWPRLRARRTVWRRALRIGVSRVGRESGDVGLSVKTLNRLLVACYVAADLLSAAAAFLLAYLIRFDGWFISSTADEETNHPVHAASGQPAGHRYSCRPRSDSRTIACGAVARVDDFFAVLVGSILAVIAGVAVSLHERLLPTRAEPLP